MRASREVEVLEFLSCSREGFTRRQLVGAHRFRVHELLSGNEVSDTPPETGKIFFPRQTLDRHLKSLIRKGVVEKVLDPRMPGERGRQATRYRISSELWRDWGCSFCVIPGKQVALIKRNKWGKLIKKKPVDRTFFLGQWRSRRYSGEEYVELLPSEKREAERHLKYWKEKKRREKTQC